MKDIDIIERLKQELGIELRQVDSPINNMINDEDGYAINSDSEITHIGFPQCEIKDLGRIINHLMELNNLTSLSLVESGLSDITILRLLKNLTSLSISGNNDIDFLCLKDFENLTKLALYKNSFPDISFLKYLINLTYLTLGGVNYSDDITPLKFLRNLNVLRIWEKKGIKDISLLGQLKNLKYLLLQDCSISDITPLADLSELTTLDLWSNQITDISAIKNLKKLDTLNLGRNPIQNLPPWITDFNMDIIWYEFGHDGITIYNDTLKTPPIQIVKQGKQAIKDYFSQIEIEEGRTENLFEAKLLVIGEGGTGKTTFIRKMLDINAQLPDEADTTLGIEIGKWSYFINFLTNSGLNDVKFHVNLWDFGGQKIYQGTHQIFFTDKSFYVLIADTREQKTDFSYWLNTVEQLGGADSSLIIVLNKKFGHEQKLDETGYRGHFGNIIKDVIELDLKNDRSQTLALQDKVKTYLRQLPGIGDPLPPSWVSIREDLSKEKANFISFDRFRKICENYDIKEASILTTLSGYFNRIGAFTHYIDDPLLQERIYLNSTWLVKTVYEVLDNEIAKSKKGRLSADDIGKIWADNELHYETNKLTQLMHKFGLMYRIPESDSYVVPAHLPTVTPYNEWPYAKTNNILQFIYEFDKYMPQGMMSRLIVALNHHIKDHDFVWHRGVNIESNGAHAEIIESYGGNNRFEIRIAGVNKIELLAIIRERFAEVLKPFNNLQYRQLIPCICRECKSSPDPAFHDYNLLLKFREKGTGSQCSKTGEIISAEELLKITEPPQSKTRKSITKRNTDIKTIKIFLASSSELLDDRKAFREFISIENDRLHREGIYLEIIQWEHFIDAMSQRDLQSEYNKAVRECDIFLSLFFTKVGKYTAIEFENAFGQFKETGKPCVYTYFKDAPIKANEIKKDDINSKFRFESKLEKLGHFKTVYEDVNDLENQFKRQLEKLLPLLN